MLALLHRLAMWLQVMYARNNEHEVGSGEGSYPSYLMASLKG